MTAISENEGIVMLRNSNTALLRDATHIENCIWRIGIDGKRPEEHPEARAKYLNRGHRPSGPSSNVETVSVDTSQALIIRGGCDPSRICPVESQKAATLLVPREK